MTSDRLLQIAAHPQSLDAAVDETVHALDGMYRGNMDHYRSCGRDAMRNVATALALADAGSPRRILDFACGFGRVGRYLRAAFPEAEMTFTDAQREASAFCAATFRGADRPVARDFAGYAPEGPFDLIWVGSLFTHLPVDKSEQLLRMLFGLLAGSGVLVFTMHGRYVESKRADGKWPYNISADQFDAMIDMARREGYGFVPYEGQTTYGISLNETRWWGTAVSALDSAEVVMFRERGWDRHQDVLAVKKIGSPRR